MADMDELEHQRRCLVRHLLALRAARGVEWLRDYVQGWRRWPELMDDFAAQWHAGNRGEPGDWREP